MAAADSGEAVVALGVVVTRVAAAFSVTPFFAPDLVPALVRNCLMVSMAAWILALQGVPDLPSLDAGALAAVILRETFLGLALGLVFSGMLWAFLIAGQLIDLKIGGAQALESDPMFGGQSPLHALALSRVAITLFLAAGGLTTFVQLLVESYAAWPLGAAAPSLVLRQADTAEGLLQTFMTSGLMIAAPALVLLTLAEGVLGLVSRAAPRLNAFSISLAAKSWLASLIVLLMVSRLAPQLAGEAATAAGKTLGLVRMLAAP